MHLAIRLFHRQTVRALEALWRKNPPDMVVSLIPNFNRAVWESLRNALPSVPMVTIITDFADYPPHFWIERQDQYLICGTDKAVEQALGMGLTKIASLSRFGDDLESAVLRDAAAQRRRRAPSGEYSLGLEPDQPVGLVLFGGQGAAVMADIARDLARPAIDSDLRQKRRNWRHVCAPCRTARRCLWRASRKKFLGTCNWRITSSANRARQH